MNVRAAVLVGTTVAILAAPAVASADTVTVLGLQSLEGDDDFALSLSGALRHAASQVAGWDVSDREISLDQMMLAHGCEEPNAACMSDVAASLATDKVIFGTVSRTSTSGDYDFAVHVRIFDRGGNQIAEELTDTIPRIRSDIDQLRIRVRRYTEQLAGEVTTGRLVVGANVEGAEVFVDGDSLGFISGGELRAELPSGSRTIEIRSEGYQSHSETVEVTADGEATINAVLIEGESSGGSFDGEVSTAGGLSRTDLGWIAIAAGGVGLVAAIIGSIIVDSIGVPSFGPDIFGDNETVHDYRVYVGEMEDDFCDAADRGVGMGDPDAGDLEEVKSKCGTASTMFAVSLIGAVVAIVGGGLGALLIATDDGGDSEAHPADSGLVLRPMLDDDRAGLSATLTF